MGDLAKRSTTEKLAALAVVAAMVVAVAALVQLKMTSAQAQLQPRAVNPWTVHGVLRIGSEEEPDTLSPLTGEQYIDQDLSMLWAGFLLTWNDRDRFVPDLAAEVPTQANGGISADGLTYTYHLRRGVLWQDGVPFTARDIVYSWHAEMGPGDQVASQVGFDQISRIDTPDPYTVVVRLHHRFAPFVGTFFSLSSAAPPVLPEHILSHYRNPAQAPYNRLPIGTGPFRVVENDLRTVRFVANPLYWRGAPHLREIDFEWLPNDQALLEALHEHRIDLYVKGAQALDPQLQGNRGYTIYLYPFNRLEDVGFNLRRPQLQDVRVRRALAYATDRVRLIDEVSNGINLPADTNQSPSSWAHDPFVRHYRYDPRLAQTLLDQAGWRLGADGVRRKGDLRMQLELVGWSGSETEAKAEAELQREWRLVGVELWVRNYSPQLLYGVREEGGIQQNGLFDVTLEEWENGVDPDDSMVFRCSMLPPRGWNIYDYCDPAVDRAEGEALSRYDLAGRKAAYDRIQVLLADDLPMIPIWYVQQEDVVNIDMQNYRPSHVTASFWNPWEWSI